MANGDAFDDAVRLARETPSLDVGCHLVLIGGRSLTAGKPFPATVAQFALALARRQIPLYDEMAAQTRRIIAAGIHPTHLDTHKHAHLAPPVLEAVARIARDFGIPWIRRPFDFPAGAPGAPRLTRWFGGVLGLWQGRFARVLAEHNCRSVDRFAGFAITGRVGCREIAALAASLPAGSTELMCHPGHCGDALRHARTRLKQSRQRELEALTAPETRQTLERHSIQLVGFAQLD
jgi:predicted glycoside hydrolase/deacetylase ChbG (UPF0249 family)